MAGLRMDGTLRPSRGAVTPAKIAKKWFEENPRNVVSFHWRWNELPAASREMMGAPRLAMVQGNVVVFGPHRSELSLKGLTEATILDDGQLRIKVGNGGAVEYKGAPEA